MAIDLDDTIAESRPLGSISTTAKSVDNTISVDTDVDMFGFAVSAGQVVDFDIDTTANGVGGVNSQLRLFNSFGQQLATNNDAVAPGENVVGFDAYLRYAFVTGGNYYLGVSNSSNVQYNPLDGSGDITGSSDTTGAYRLSVQALAADPDDALSEAVSLGTITTLPVTRSTTISTDIDVDMYRFNVSAGQVVDFDIDTAANGPDGLGSYLRLFDSSGTQLAFNNDGAAPGENTLGFDAYLRFTFATAGTYYLGVSNFNNAAYNPVTGGGDIAGGLYSIGSYSLTAQALPVDTDDTISEAVSLGTITTVPATRNTSISTDIDVDMYRFIVSAGQVVDFDIDTATNGPDGLNTYLKLFNSLGNPLASSDDAAAPGEAGIGFDAYLRYTFATAGTYYIAVSNANNATYNPLTGGGDTAGGLYSIGTYQLSVQTPSAPPTDLDDTIAESRPLGSISTTAKSVDNTISVDTDVDMFGFAVSAGQVVDFDIDTTANGVGGVNSQLRLFNSFGQLLATNNDAVAPGENVVGFDAYLRYAFVTAGNYYLGVSNSSNVQYNPLDGSGDITGSSDTTGAYRLSVQALAADPDDALSEAVSLGTITTLPVTRSTTISTDIDVDMYRFNVSAGQVIDFDIDTAANGPDGLGSYLRLFDSSGTQLAFNNDGAAPGENTLGFDAYLRFTFATTGTYYLGVSNFNNAAYNPVTGGSDTAGGLYSIGSYSLIVQALPPVTIPSLAMTVSASSIPELGGQATVTLTRSGGDISQPLTVTLSSSDTASATVPATAVFAANASTTTFLVNAVHSLTLGSRQVDVTATAVGIVPVSRTILITDSDGTFHNPANPLDTNDDGYVSPIDALLIVNYLNTVGPGPVPEGLPPPYYDVNGDNFISPIDALIVINALNSQAAGEGESGLAPPADHFKPAWSEAVDAVFAHEASQTREAGLLP